MGIIRAICGQAAARPRWIATLEKPEADSLRLPTGSRLNIYRGRICIIVRPEVNVFRLAWKKSRHAA
jgi:hypothetical protein